MITVGILLLAGGSSSRMRGADKVMEEVRGLPLLVDRAKTCLASDASEVVVVTNPDKPDRQRALEGLDIVIVENDGAHQGMAHSLKRGIHHITADAVLIMLADMPELTAQDLNHMITNAQNLDATILRGATQAGMSGHPVVIKRALFNEFEALHGDQGAAPILVKHRDSIVLIPLPNEHATTDLDTPEAWANWRAKT